MLIKTDKNLKSLENKVNIELLNTHKNYIRNLSSRATTE